MRWAQVHPIMKLARQLVASIPERSRGHALVKEPGELMMVEAVSGELTFFLFTGAIDTQADLISFQLAPRGDRDDFPPISGERPAQHQPRWGRNDRQ